MPHCVACGEQIVGVVFRTRDPKCHTFKGDKDDPRNGIRFHTREGVVLESDAVPLVVAAKSIESWQRDGWKPPKKEPKENS